MHAIHANTEFQFEILKKSDAYRLKIPHFCHLRINFVRIIHRDIESCSTFTPEKDEKFGQISAHFGITIARLPRVKQALTTALFCSIFQHKLGIERPKLTCKRYLSASNCKHSPKQAAKIANQKRGPEHSYNFVQKSCIKSFQLHNDANYTISFLKKM